MNINKTSLRHTIQSALSLGLILLPWLISSTQSSPKLSGLAQVAGVLLALLTNPKATALLNLLLPTDSTGAVPQPSTDDVTALPVSKGRPTSAGPLALLVLAGSLLLGSNAWAQSPQAIGCFDAGNTWCVVPAAAVGWQNCRELARLRAIEVRVAASAGASW